VSTARGIKVCSVPIETTAIERARWLAELSEALNDAHHVMQRLPWAEGQRVAAQELYLRIEAARLEAQSLRLSRSLNPRTDVDPGRTGFAPWDSPEKAG
jgi:hypothetical protein